ncbi:MAG: hypothetical protein U0326_34110 [Polyangiales bacterium]
MLLVATEGVERAVRDLEEPALLEVRRRDAPASPQVTVDVVCEDAAKRLLGVLALEVLHVGVDRVDVEGQVERVEHPLHEGVMTKPFSPRAANSAEDGRAQKRDLDEVVEVPRLEGGVLAVVGEAQHLASTRLERRVATKLPHGGERQHGGRGTSPFGPQRRELAEVRALVCVVLNAAAEAEQKRRGDPVRTDPGADDTVRRDPERLGSASALRRAHGRHSVPQLDPALGEPCEHIGVLGGPGGLVIEVQKSHLTNVSIIVPLAEVARDEERLALLTHTPNDVVVLTALATEREGEEHPGALRPRNELLPLEGEMARRVSLGRGVDRLPLRDELVEPEGEHWPPMRVAERIPAKERLSKRAFADIVIEPRSRGEASDEPCLASQRQRSATHEPPIRRITQEPQRRLDPTREWISEKRVPFFGRLTALDARAQRGIVDEIVGGHSSKRLADHVAGLDRGPEEHRRDAGDLGLLLAPGRSACHRRRSPDVKEFVCLADLRTRRTSIATSEPWRPR